MERVDSQLPKQGRQERRLTGDGSGQASVEYAELHCTTNFTFLEGASSPEQYVRRAAELGLSAVAITDRNTLAGVVRAYREAKELSQRVIVGCELNLTNGERLIILPRTRDAYSRLSRLITMGRRRASKGSCRLVPADLVHLGGEQIAIFLPPAPGADVGERGADGTALERRLRELRELFASARGSRCYLALTHHLSGIDVSRLRELDALSRRVGVAAVVVNSALMHEASRAAVADVLTAIGHGCQMEQLGDLAQRNHERYLKSPQQMLALFSGYREAVQRTAEIARAITFCLSQLRFNYPREVMGSGNPHDELERLVASGVRRVYGTGAPKKVTDTLRHELEIIRELDYAPYFLTVNDIVRFARKRGILCQGRGSAANSVVCYVLGITSVSPQSVDMVFERFVSAARGEPPDIDVDFEAQRREEIIQYIYGKYGRHRTAMTATVISYRARSALNDVGRAFGMSQEVIARLSSVIWGWSRAEIDEDALAASGLNTRDPRLMAVLELVGVLTGFPRHLGQHVGGMVVTDGRLDELVPLENAAMEDRTVVQWDKDDLETLGILKVDILSLGMLTAISKSFALLRRHYGRVLSMSWFSHDDKAVYEMLSRADTIGVFQVESRAQMSFLPRMKPKNYYDLVIEIAIVRPGPIQGKMVHPYLRRRNGLEPVEYPSPQLREVLQKTLGIPLFQEQAMRIATVAAGFTPTQADSLRRAMATWRKGGEVESFREKFIAGAMERGYQREFAQRCFAQIEGFSDYGFPESHSASFAALAYVSAWLKCYYPAAFTCALCNSQPMGFYGVAQLLRDAREHGVTVLPADVNRSQWDFTLESLGDDMAIRTGLRQIGSLTEDDGEWIIAARGNGYTEPIQLWQRAGISGKTMQLLARADAFASMGVGRRDALWETAGRGDETPLPLLEPKRGTVLSGEAIQAVLREMSAGQSLVADYRSVGFSLRSHPLALLRNQLGGCVSANSLRRVASGATIDIAGIVLARQRPATAAGVVFLTLEDETGWANLVIWARVFQQHRHAVMHGRLLRVRGRVEQADNVVHVIAHSVQDASTLLEELGTEVPTHAEMGNISAAQGGRASQANAKRAAATPRASSRHPRERSKRLFPSRDFH